MKVVDLSINLFVTDLVAAQDFYRTAFGATKQDESHFTIGKFKFALAALPQNSPKVRGGVGLCLQLWVEDLEKTLATSLAAGAKTALPGTEKNPIFRTPAGERVTNVEDPDGHIWSLTAID